VSLLAAGNYAEEWRFPVLATEFKQSVGQKKNDMKNDLFVLSNEHSNTRDQV
jgi:hypothetical protein